MPRTVVAHVADRAGLPIQDATISTTCLSHRVQTTTDAHGDSALVCSSGLGPIRVEAEGFAPQVLNAGSGLRLSIVLDASPVFEAMSVTATRSNSPLGAIAKTVFVLGPEELHDYPAVTLDEDLRQHAGLELFRRAPNRVANPTSEGVSLRGLGSTAASRTLVLEDGAPLNDPFGGYVHWNESPHQAVESVVLVSGGGSDLYGSSAVGGVIDVVPVSPASTYLDVSAAAGSEDTTNFQSTAAGHGKHLSALMAGESLRTRGYRLPDPALAGPVDTPANVRSQAYRAEVGRRDFATKPIFLTGNLLNENRSNGTPLQTNATRLWRYLAGYDLKQTRFATERIRLFGSDEGYRQSFSAVGANRSSEFLTRLQRVHTQELGGSADATVELRHIVAVAGADVRDLRATDDETPIAKGKPNGRQDVTARQRFVGGFGESLVQWRGWSGAASLRVDGASNFDVTHFTQTGTGASRKTPVDRSEVVLSPRIGLVRTLGSQAALHASGYRAFRTPTFNELYRTGQVGQEITLANSALLSERATGWEFGAQISTASRRVDLQTTYFWTEINRPVSAVLVSQTASTITNQRKNLGQIRSRGVELALTLHPVPSFTAMVGYQYADASVTKFSADPSLVGNRIPQVPHQSFTAQVRAANSRFGELTLASRAAGKVFDDSGNRFPLEGYFQMDLSGSRELPHGFSAFFLVQNLTGHRLQVSRTPILTLGSPTFAELGLKLHLGRPKH